MNAWLENADGERFTIEGQLTIGRFADCNVVLRDARVSRWHALIHRVGAEKFWIVDYGSRNGIYLNGRRLAEPQPLSEGDEILVAAHQFRFHQPRATGSRRAENKADPGDRTEAATDAYTAIGHAAILIAPGGTVQRMPDQARRWLEAYFGDVRPKELPQRITEWMASTASAASPLVVRRDDGRLVVRWAGEQRLLLLVQEQSMFSVATLQSLGLTIREAEVMKWMAEGKTTPEIAVILATSPRTAEKHIEHIFEKLGVETRAAALVRAMEMLNTRR